MSLVFDHRGRRRVGPIFATFCLLLMILAVAFIKNGALLADGC